MYCTTYDGFYVVNKTSHVKLEQFWDTVKWTHTFAYTL